MFGGITGSIESIEKNVVDVRVFREIMISWRSKKPKSNSTFLEVGGLRRCLYRSARVP